MLNLDNTYNSTKLFDNIRARILRLIGRAKLTTVSNSKKTQLVQVKALKDETITDIERFQEYGFETYPKADAEVLTLFPGGNRDQGSVVCIMDTRYRPTNLTEGEVQIYDWNESLIYLKSDNSIYIESKSGCKFDLKSDGTFSLKDNNGNEIKTTTTQIDFNGNLTVDI
jgi:phage baseplate assembly protein V